MFDFKDEKRNMFKFEYKKIESLNNFYDSLKGNSCTAVAENLSNYLFFSLPEEDMKPHFINPNGGKSLFLLLSLCGRYNFMTKMAICLSKSEKIILKNNLEMFLEKPKWQTSNENYSDFMNSWTYILFIKRELEK